MEKDKLPNFLGADTPIKKYNLKPDYDDAILTLSLLVVTSSHLWSTVTEDKVALTKSEPDH